MYLFNLITLPQQQFPIFLMNPTFYSNHHQNIIPGVFDNTSPSTVVPEQPLEQEQPQPLRPVQETFVKIEELDIMNVNEAPQAKEEEKLPFVDKHNIVPNNTNHLLAFIQRKSKSVKVIEKIIRRETVDGDSYSSEGFYAYQKTVRNRLSVHVNIKALEQAITHLDRRTSAFSIEEQMFYNKVARIAICYYLRAMGPLVTLNSQRLRNTTKQDHLKAQRYIQRVLRNIDLGNAQNCGRPKQMK